jgi:predicted dehydrogenase
MKLRVGITGCGIGQVHARAYGSLPGLYEVRGICDLDSSKAGALAAEAGAGFVTASFAALCARTDIDVIDICTPSGLHAPQVLEALATGKHVICEKPVAGSLRDVEGLIAAEARAGRRVMPIFQSRFSAGARKLRLLRDSGIAGTAYLVTAETAWRRRPEYYATPWRGKWETELGGALLTLGIHAVDFIVHFMGPAARTFAAVATRVNPIETEDCLSATLQMADGSLVSYGLTTGSALESSRMRFCFAGMVAESSPSAYEWSSDPWTFAGDTPEISARIEEVLRGVPAGPEGFAGQFAAFHAAVAADTATPVTLHDARRTLEVITAIYTSAHRGVPVDLPIAATDPAWESWRPS